MTFEEYVRARGPALVRLARLLARDRDLAEDLVQEVLSRAYPRWPALTRDGRTDMYLRRMLVNANASWWRRSSNRELALGSGAITAMADRPARSGLDVESAERDAMWRQILRLPERQRAVLVLRYYEDLDDAAIAEILDCSPATVRTHAMRALITLRERHLAPGLGRPA